MQRAACPIIAVGASGAEGLRDMGELLSLLPATLGAAIVMVLHRPRDRHSFLASILQRSSALPVRVAAEGEPLKAGACYIGEPARHLTIACNGKARLLCDEGGAYRGRTIDLLFNSIAEFWCAPKVGVILSGSLADGSAGLAALARRGGIAIVRQPSQSSPDMPRNAIARVPGLHFIGPVWEVGHAVRRLTEELTTSVELSACKQAAHPPSVQARIAGTSWVVHG